MPTGRSRSSIRRSGSSRSSPYAGSIPTNDDTPLYRSADEMVKLANELISENDEYAVIDVSQPLTSVAYDTSWGTIHQAVNDAYNQYMVGQIDMAGFEDVVDQQRSAAMDDVSAALTAAALRRLRHLVGNDPPGRERRLQPVHGRTDRHGRLRGRRRPAAQRRHGRRDRRVHRLLRVHSLTPTPAPT